MLQGGHLGSHEGRLVATFGRVVDDDQILGRLGDGRQVKVLELV
jgi:hypothetical protein